MAPFSIPAPCIVPYPMPLLGGPKSINTNTKIQLLCDTCIEHEVFYTVDGTKPQPYAGIVQGSKTLKYNSPFCLPVGKITVKAIAIHAHLHSMCSSIITKCFEVVKAESEQKMKHSPKKKLKRKKKKVDEVSSSILNELVLYDVIEEPPDFNSDEVADDHNKVMTNGDVPAESNGDVSAESSDDDDIVKNEDQQSINSSSMEESLEEDKSVHDMEENSLLEAHNLLFEKSETSPKKSRDFTKVPSDRTFLKDDFIEENMNAFNDQSDLYFARESNLQKCFSCQGMNTVSSKFCMHCGQRLKLLCKICGELNEVIASFCQFCGKKMDSEKDEVSQSSNGLNTKEVSVQCSVKNFDKSIQTSPIKVNKNQSTPPVLKRRLPSHSPGRGYWHQQLDYICNNLKSYAYNNIDFRNSISEPTLGKFQSGEVSKSEDNVTVTIIFSPFIMDKLEDQNTLP